jgi:hypothetical protein
VNNQFPSLPFLPASYANPAENICRQYSMVATNRSDPEFPDSNIYGSWPVENVSLESLPHGQIGRFVDALHGLAQPEAPGSIGPQLNLEREFYGEKSIALLSRVN